MPCKSSEASKEPSQRRVFGVGVYPDRDGYLGRDPRGLGEDGELIHTERIPKNVPLSIHIPTKFKLQGILSDKARV